jgi:ketosteroid isomerase-like protein
LKHQDTSPWCLFWQNQQHSDRRAASSPAKLAVAETKRGYPMPMRTGIAAFTLLLLTAACTPQREVPTNVERARLDQRQDEFFAAVAARDEDRTAAMFADRAMLHVANMPAIEGRDAIRRFYGNLYGFLSASRATPDAMQMSASADMAYTVGRTVNEFRGPEGMIEFAGKFVLVWQLIDGDWMITLYGISSDERPPSAGH